MIELIAAGMCCVLMQPMTKGRSGLWESSLSHTDAASTAGASTPSWELHNQHPKASLLFFAVAIAQRTFGRLGCLVYHTHRRSQLCRSLHPQVGAPRPNPKGEEGTQREEEGGRGEAEGEEKGGQFCVHVCRICVA